LIVFIYFDTLGLEHLPVPLFAAWIAGSKSARFVNDPLPWQIWIAKVGDATDNPGSPGIACQRSNLAISHDPPFGDLGDQSFYALPECTICFHG
jgi:hypothetical protein